MVKQQTSKKEKLIKLCDFFNVRNVSLVLAVFVFGFIFFKVGQIINTLSALEQNQSSLIKELGETKDLNLKIGRGLNDVQKYLDMPMENYYLSDIIQEIPEESENENQLEMALFLYIDSLGKNQKAEKLTILSRDLLNVVTTDEEISSSLASLDLSIAPAVETEESISVEVNHAQYGQVFSYKISKDDGFLYLLTPEEESEVKDKTPEEFKSSLLQFIKTDVPIFIKDAKNFQDKKTQVDNTLKSQAVLDAIAKKNLTIDEFSLTSATEFSYQFLNKAYEPVAQVIIDKKTSEIFLKDLSNPDLKEQVIKLPDSLISFLSKLDARTNLEKRADESKKSLEATLNDKGFKSLLTGLGLRFSMPPREDDSRIYYDLFGFGDKHLSSIVIEKATGIVNIVASDGTNSQNLLYFDPEFKKKTLEIPSDIPDYGNTLFNGSEKFHVLLIGKHGGNTDTIIMVQLDEKTRKAQMVSIPRDLSYNGRKINAYYTIYGMKEFIKAIQNITGYKVDKYALVDMYAFIDVVDLIGGIDITLKQSLIDPFYRVVDNGVEGTLHYEPGDYHLTGVEALRIARSRKTTSDFSRAERQQIILEAIQKKIKSLGLSDITTIYEVARVVLKKLETDVSFEEAIGYYFKYKDYKIESNAVMSSGNVLYSPPYQPIEECQQIISDAEAAGQPKPTCEEDTNHAYILLPKDEDWNVIKWYFRQQFE